MADVLSETTLTVPQLAQRLPGAKGATQSHRATVCRWITRGVTLPSGAKLRLEAVRLGGRWVTSLEAFQRFSEINTLLADGQPSRLPRTPAQVRRDSERAARKLNPMIAADLAAVK